MSLVQILGKLLGVENLDSVGEFEFSFAAPWAQEGPAWLFFGLLGLAALSIAFYMKCQGVKVFPSRAREDGSGRALRIALAGSRAALLSILLLILAEPILTVRITSSPRPLLWVLLDGTDSFGIVDELTPAEREGLDRAAGISRDGISRNGAPPGAEKLSRAGYVQAFLRKKERNILRRLEEKFRLQAFAFEGTEGVRSIGSGSGEDRLDPEAVARELGTAGQVTAIGTALAELKSRGSPGNLAGVLIVSDFDQNAGPPALQEAAKLGVPVHTLGVGPASAVDLKVDLQAPPLMKKAERSTITAILRQTGLTGKAAKLKLAARRLGGSGGASAPPVPVSEVQVTLEGPTRTIEVPYTPADAGRFLFEAEAERMEGEIVDQNNRAERECQVLDDFLRLLFIEHEPTWEWRFIKEVFHRDKLVGLRGFRTFLRSADPKVRQTNQLFLPSMTPARSEFFANDVIFLGDIPGSSVTPRFAEMVREFVGKFGGGLVVLSGPRFGPGALAGTPLADMLPVIVDPDLRVRAEGEFRLRLSAEASQFDFMTLGSGGAESEKAWSDLGPLPWYQPVARLSPLGTCLAEHPSETCSDGKTPQPLIALRRYGRGEVVYLGFNETWRLRRKHGELYYRQFWGQMIHRLGMSHALGSQKRFVVRTDRREYRVDDDAIATVEAYDGNFEPLSPEKLPGRKLEGELVLPGPAPGSGGTVQPLSIPFAREGTFEARFPVLSGGEHRLRVKDPITGECAEVSFQVTSLSAERRSAVRNAALQTEIAAATGGNAYDLETADRLPDEVKAPILKETSVRAFPIWNTWLCFCAVMALMLGEWLVRKLVNLT